jgi:hypothetical protein
MKKYEIWFLKNPLQTNFLSKDEEKISINISTWDCRRKSVRDNIQKKHDPCQRVFDSR